MISQRGVAGVSHDAEEPGTAVCSLVEGAKKAIRPQIGLLHHIFGIFLVFHQPTTEVVRIFYERQKQSFKTGASLLVIHGRRLPYNKTYRLSLKYIPESRF